jgi:predicted exporter
MTGESADPGDGRERRRRLVAWVWLLATAACAGLAWHWWAAPGAVRTDLRALLPPESLSLAVQQAEAQLVRAAERRVVVLVGGGDLASAMRAADAWHAAARRAQAFQRITYAIDAGGQERWRAFYALYRHSLLAEAHRQGASRDADREVVREAARWLYSPVGLPGGLPLVEDPLQLFGSWQLERGRDSPFRVLGERLVATEAGRTYVAALADLDGSPFDRETQRRAMAGLEAAREAARESAAGVEVLAAGVVLHAAETAQRAEREVAVVGLGSLLGIGLLMVLAFRSVRPMLVAQVPILVGCLAATALAARLFGGLHVLTLVFGASLLGVAVDYGLHYLCHLEAAASPLQRVACLRRLSPGLLLAWVTTILAYLAMAIPPFPGLREMAAFAGIGLLCAWLTVLAWLPLLARGGPHGDGWLVRGLAALPARLRANRLGGGIALAAVFAAAAGLPWATTDDDIRLLQSSSPARLAQDQRVAALAGIPSTGSFLLIAAGTPDGVLRTEEETRAGLERLRERGLISGYQAISQWVPSETRQRHNHEWLGRRVYGPGGWLDALGREVGLPARWLQVSRASHARAGAQVLHLEAWLADPVSVPWRHLWIGAAEGGYASVVTVRGLKGEEGRAGLEAVARTVRGATVVDRVGDLSRTLGAYRRQMTLVLAIAYLLVLAALAARYGRSAWRVIGPTLLGALAALGVFGWLGMAINLFTVLGLLLVLGIGIDYGIYMHEERLHPGKSWLAVCLSALSTLLSFGLLAFSMLPAMRAFGLAVLMGVSLAWLLAPAFSAREPAG